MVTQSVRSIVGWCAMLIAGLPALSGSSSLQAEETSTARKRPNPPRLEQRIERLEKRLLQLRGELDPAAAAPQKSDPTPSGRRYQMMRVGERLVILDADTGETRIIEADSGRPIQHVEVGKALVVVTMLGRVITQRPPPVEPAPKKLKP